MLKLDSAGLVSLIVVGLLCVGGGSATADPVTLPDVTRSTDPDIEGWHLSASLTGMSINAVPNMAATAFTREGFVTATARLDIDGRGKTKCYPKLTADDPESSDNRCVVLGALSLWAQTGCQINLKDGIDLGGDNRVGRVNSVGIDSAGTVSASGTPIVADQLNPDITLNLKPGMIDESKLGFKAFAPKYPEPHDEHSDDDENMSTEQLEWEDLAEGGPFYRAIKVRDSEVKVNACGGPVFVRLHAKAQIFIGTPGATKESKAIKKSITSVDVYSDILPL